MIWLPENVGHAGARRIAFEPASNEVIAIMDADDVSVPNRFEKKITYIEQHPDCDALGGQIAKFIDEDTNIVGRREVPMSHSDILIWLKERCLFN